MRSRWTVLMAVIALAGCPESRPTDKQREAPSSKPTTSATRPSYPAAPWLPARVAESKGKAQGGIVAVTRILVSSLSEHDPIGFAIRFEGEGGPWARGDAPGDRVVDWSKTMATVEIVLTMGEQEEVLTLAATPTHTDKSALSQRVRTLLIQPEGVRQFAAVSAWKTPPQLLGKTGALALRMRGKLALSGAEAVAFETAAMNITVEESGKGMLPLSNLEGIASRLIVSKEKLEKGPLKRMGPIIDDEKGNRLLRLHIAERSEAEVYQRQIADVAMSAKGAVLAVHRSKQFTCVAEGTKIATPDGDVPVETLRRGDAVWSYDTDRNERVPTRVEDIAEGHAGELLLIHGLRVTGRHPLFINGQWREARLVQENDTLLSRELQSLAVGTIEREHTPTRVFDLSVSWPHDYFANGILVHNKIAPAQNYAADDLWQGLFARGKPSRPD